MVSDRYHKYPNTLCSGILLFYEHPPISVGFCVVSVVIFSKLSLEEFNDFNNRDNKECKTE